MNEFKNRKVKLYVLKIKNSSFFQPFFPCYLRYCLLPYYNHRFYVQFILWHLCYWSHYGQWINKCTIALFSSVAYFVLFWSFTSAQCLYSNRPGLRNMSTGKAQFYGKNQRVYFYCYVIEMTRDMCFYSNSFLFNVLFQRYFGLKSLIRPVRNNFVPVIVLNEVDALLNPIALVLCYYTSVIFLRDIHGSKKERIVADIPMKVIEGKRRKFE